jgi:hypothetical protein
MSFFGKLFGKSTPQSSAVSKLDEFLSQIRRDEIHAHARKSKNLQLPTAITLLTLEQSGRFTRDLFAAFRKSPIPVAQNLFGGRNFDAAVFETAAFISYSFMAKELAALEGQRDEDEDEIDELDDEDASDEDRDATPYFSAVRDAHHLTWSFLEKFLSFNVNDKVFINRIFVYSDALHRRRSMVEVFEGMLIAAVEAGGAAPLRPQPSTTVGLSIMAATHARTFFIATLPTLVDVVHDVVKNRAKLGFD